MSKRNKGNHTNEDPSGEPIVEAAAPSDEGLEPPIAEAAPARDEGVEPLEALEAPLGDVGEPNDAPAEVQAAPAVLQTESVQKGRKKPHKGKGTKVTVADAVAPQLDAGASADPEEAVIDMHIDEVPDNVRDLFGADALHADGSEVAAPQGDAVDELDAEAFEVEEGVEALEGERLISVVESLLFASDRLLSLGDLRRLTSVRETKKVQHALDEIKDRHAASGIILVEAGGSFRFQTNPLNVEFVSRIVQGKPIRLSRAMMETLAIVAYKQPITRPEVDDVRGVDCGPVLRTLLDRNLIRVIGKKEDVGRPLLYGTTPEFLKTFNLSDLTELPTLREFHELGAEETAKMKKTFGDDAVADLPTRASAEGPEAAKAAQEEAAAEAGPAGRVEGLKGDRPSAFSNHTVADVPEDDSLIEELERATEAATRALEAGKSEPGAPVS